MNLSEGAEQVEGGLPLECPRLHAVPAGRSHASQIQACFEGAPDYFSLTEGQPPGGGAAEHLLEDAEADANRRVYLLVPRVGGPAVGVLDLHLHYPEPGTAHVGLLLFRESCQGLGYGKETVAAAEQALAEAGFDALRLSVVDENVEAKAFWERLGFGEAGRLDRGVTVYEKRLQAD
ncbi:GNAT family N-acetyltransferase [Anaeromyxobacter paludicola]|uniref:N-acetyltransferase n=1 Tax=Anaeromyxobacter paludicola TaxID=2918171 RepID=A0ABM7XB01_9BACT|nr:GNAT family N-acetyltransferase [Anaeromyxobacter paludicola]BDG08999.1 N-acetyltransferase [Anaeromyxobacter paludicola]